MYEGKNIRNTDSLERCRGDDTLDSLLKKADESMYLKKTTLKKSRI